MALRELRVSNLAVIEEARLSFDEGFSVLTGETGSGKSMCVNALRAALGGRLEPETVRAGAVAARVAAVFDNPSPRLRARRAELGIPDDDLITLSREVPASGRAVCRIDGALVSQAVLRELGDLCVDVTAQGTSHRMLRRSWQREVLDAFGGNECAAARTATAAAVQAWRDAEDAVAGGPAGREHRCCGAAASPRPRRRPRTDAYPRGRGCGAADRAAPAPTRQPDRRMCRWLSPRQAAATSSPQRTGSPRRSEVVPTSPPSMRSCRPCSRKPMSWSTGFASSRSTRAATPSEITVDEARLTAVEERLDMLARVTRRHGSLESALAELDRATALVSSVDGEAGAIETLEAAAETRASRGRRGGRTPERRPGIGGAPPRASGHRGTPIPRAPARALPGGAHPQPRRRRGGCGRRHAGALRAIGDR